jgi:hypothetical protein
MKLCILSGEGTDVSEEPTAWKREEHIYPANYGNLFLHDTENQISHIPGQHTIYFSVLLYIHQILPFHAYSLTGITAHTHTR